MLAQRYLGLAVLVSCVAVEVALWWYFSQPPQPQYVGQSWLEQRTLELADKAESGLATRYSDAIAKTTMLHSLCNVLAVD